MDVWLEAQGAIGLDIGIGASRTDVLCLATSSVLILTGLDWIAIKQKWPTSYAVPPFRVTLFD